MDTFIQLTLNGLTLGSVYALIALGYSLVYGILKLLNFAHGDVFMVGTFIGFGALQLLGGSIDPIVPVWALLVLITLAAMAGCAVLGVAIERFAYRPLRDAPRIAPLISALGVSFFIAYSMQLMFGAALKNYDTFSLDGGALYFNGLRHRQRPRAVDPDHHDRLGVRDDDPALAARHADADRQGDARDVARSRGRRDDGHRHRQGDRVRVRARLGARRRGGRAVRAPRSRRTRRSAS